MGDSPFENDSPELETVLSVLHDTPAQVVDVTVDLHKHVLDLVQLVRLVVLDTRGQEETLLLQVDKELAQLPDERLELDRSGPGKADNAEVEEEIVPSVSLVVEVGRVAGYLVAQTVDSDRLGLQLILGDDEAGETVEVLFTEEVSGPLTADERSLVRMELGQEYGSDGADLSTALVLGSCHLPIQTRLT